MCIFKSWQKDAVFVEAWMDAGRLFNTAGPASLNSRSPKNCLQPQHSVHFTAS